ncbi:MAG: DNA-directed RNA polymerase subunit H [Candidatus Diapherotrites archaeon]|nr:DNA-directed RNA polymerase subunit H [Candidatus Diapherotrites archaeon]
MVLKKVADHYLVPKHEIVSKERVPELLEKLGKSIDVLPKISAEDPAVIEIGAESGDILKISRKSPTAGETYYFRIVF